MDNKFPGKDITAEDLKSKFPLASSLRKKKIIKISNEVSFGGNQFPIIAGPNTIENRDMFFRCCEFMEKNKLHLLRAAIYKPLTFPYRSKKYFELGDSGLKILQDVKKNFDVLLVSEIMDSDKISNIIDLIDIFQIGSRNMQNYSLLKKVAKTYKPILLKRHYGASLRDLLGAAEYILLENNPNVILCERGITAPHTHRATSRFILDIQAIPAIKESSCLPVISDPSHACFWYKWVDPLALASLAVGAEGLMIEFHPHPRKAAVDPLQAIGFNEFSSLLKKLKKIASFFGKRIV